MAVGQRRYCYLQRPGPCGLVSRLQRASGNVHSRDVSGGVRRRKTELCARPWVSCDERPLGSQARALKGDVFQNCVNAPINRRSSTMRRRSTMSVDDETLMHDELKLPRPGECDGSRRKLTALLPRLKVPARRSGNSLPAAQLSFEFRVLDEE